MLERHCARCHQGSKRAPTEQANGTFANILSLDALARTPGLVRPGEPDASPLYQAMVARQMPPELRRPAQGLAPDFTAPDATELAAVRAWIASLEGSVKCSSGPTAAPEDLAADIERAIGSADPAAASELRFISLAGLARRCANKDELVAAKAAVTRILNSLSWSKDAAAVDTVGESGVLLAFRLSRLGWTREHWELLVARAGAELPHAPQDGTAQHAQQHAHGFAIAAEATVVVGTRVPVVDAGWLAATILDPEVYARLLGLPQTLDELGSLLHVSLDEMRENRTLRRAAILKSAETSAPRVIEYYPGRYGSLWAAHDYPADTTPSDLLDHPLQPWLANVPAASADASRQHAAAGGEAAEPDVPEVSTGSSVIFTLPNGLPGFAAYDAQGRRIAKTPMKAKAGLLSAAGLVDEGAAVKATPAGMRCASCHALGGFSFDDSLAAHVEGAAYGGADIEREIARPTLFSAGEALRLVDEGRARIKSVWGEPVQLDGQDPVLALARLWDGDVDLAVAADTLGLTRAELESQLAELPPELASVALRLRYGRITRDEFGAIQAQLAAPPPTPAHDDPGASARGEDTRLRLELWPDKPAYATGDTVVLSARTSAPCHLTLVNIDLAGQATVLFPNEFDRDNLMKAGREIRVPGSDADYRFRVKSAGAETFVAICEAGEPVPAGMSPDFTKQNFTPLGVWDEFIASAHKSATEARVPLDNGDDPDRRFRRQRRGDTKEQQKPPPDGAPAQARAAIKLHIHP